MSDKMILDVTCGARQIWFQKHEPHTLYCDRRREHFEDRFGANHSKRTLDINPDMECDFTKLPFDDETFHLVVFDPPHLIGESDAWLKKAFSFYDTKKNSRPDGCSRYRRVHESSESRRSLGVQVERNPCIIKRNH